MLRTTIKYLMVSTHIISIIQGSEHLCKQAAFSHSNGALPSRLYFSAHNVEIEEAF